jgi:NAD(P)H-dependent flavin oxidoreductase YrpB (nitropropane dioxygenase family)
MSGTARAELAATVSEAGGLGLIDAWPAKGPEWLRKQIQSVRERTQQPFGVGWRGVRGQLDKATMVKANRVGVALTPDLFLSDDVLAYLIILDYGGLI